MRKLDMPSAETIAKATKSVIEPLPDSQLKKWRIKNMESGLTAHGTVRKRNYTARKPK